MATIILEDVNILLSKIDQIDKNSLGISRIYIAY